MNERLKKAFAELNKAATAWQNADKKLVIAHREASELWDQVFSKDKKHGDPTTAEAMAASRQEDEARAKKRIANNCYMAMGEEVLRIAVDEIRRDALEHPEKYKNPLSWKKTRQNILEIVGDDFYIDGDYSFYLVFRPALKHDRKFVWNETDGNPDPALLFKWTTEAEALTDLTYKEIKAEAIRAEKAAQKIKKLMEDATAKAGEIKETFHSAIANYLPSIYPTCGIKNNEF